MIFVGGIGTILGIMVNNEMSRRDSAKDDLREGKLLALEERIRLKPLDQRLRDFLRGLRDVGKKLVAGIVSGKEDDQLCRVEMTFDEDAEFRRLCEEDGAAAYVTLLPPEPEDSAIDVKDTGVTVKQVRFRVNKSLFLAERAAAMEEKLRPKSLPVRLRDFLNKLDPSLLQQVAATDKNVFASGTVEFDLPQETASALNALCLEEGASKYVRIEIGLASVRHPKDPKSGLLPGLYVHVKLTIFRSLLDAE